MTEALKKYATQNVPRYTSYPTAPHFKTALGAQDYARWLGALDPAEPVSLYLHVPFCRQLCWYCGCNMKLAAKRAPIAAYAETLLSEIELLARHLPGRLTVSHLHWGGGTPTALSPEDLDRAMARIRHHFDFAPDAELAIESDPRTLSDAMIARIGALGFTRASFGVQEFDPKVQAAINRVQPPGMVWEAVDKLRAAGVGGINFDLIYGLPHQTEATLLNTVRLCADMAPDRIALFGYAHVPWMAKKQRLIDEAALPGPQARMGQARVAAQALQEAGFLAIGLDHFARPEDGMARAMAEGSLHRNFQGYTTDRAQTLLGLGASSIGRTPSGYVQNTAEPGAWARSVEAGVLPVAKGCALDAEDRLRGHVIEEIMCLRAVDLAAAGRRFGIDGVWWAEAEAELAAMRRDGLVSYNGAQVAVTPKGVAVVRVVAALFDAYLAQSQRRHSVAV